MLADAEAFAAVATELAALVGDADVVAGIEARGFLLGAAAALVAGTGVVPLRKAGKLPRVAASQTYQLEYGTATLELPADTVRPGARVFVVDDVLATGGTAAAACDAAGRGGRRGGRLRRAARAHRARRPGPARRGPGAPAAARLSVTRPAGRPAARTAPHGFILREVERENA